MGFFSQDCEACGHPLLGMPATDRTNRWMNDGVAIMPDGKIITGGYDGYGMLDGTFEGTDEDGDYPEPTFSWESGVTTWHQRCWELSGSPTDNRGDSRSSADQGWFFNDEDHDVPEPQSLDDIAAAKAKAEATAAETAREEAAAQAEWDARKSSSTV